MPASGTALLVIDVQESFRHRAYWSGQDVPRFLERLQALADGARQLSIPVVQIFHVDGDGIFSLASGFVRTLNGLTIAPDATFHKNRHSALVGTGLDAWLRERGINRLLISGIRTEQCCETTTRHASDTGYQVSFVTEATLTFPMEDKQGRRWSAEEIQARTELVLDGRFARIVTVAQVLEECAAKAGAGAS